MILDAGICSIFRKVDLALSGEMPRPGFELIGQSWYGERSFETNPARPKDGRTELRTDARVRILQNRGVRQHDVVILRDIADFAARDVDETVYRITRAWHGQDDDGPTQVTDLTLEVFEP